MATARTIIKKSLQKIGVLVKQEDPTADEANDALDALNNLLSSWSNDDLSIYARTWESFTLTGNDGEYTIGTGGDFNTVRPIQIVDGYTRLTVDDQPLRIVSDEIYAMIANKSVQGRPEVLNYDNANPLAKIRLWPVPDQAYTMGIQSEKQLSQFTLDDTIVLPPGWERALVYNLAVEQAPEYGQEVTQGVYKIAVESKGLIMRSINKVRGMKRNPAMSGGFDVRTRRT
jgi:hypothetical protein